MPSKAAIVLACGLALVGAWLLSQESGAEAPETSSDAADPGAPPGVHVPAAPTAPPEGAVPKNGRPAPLAISAERHRARVVGRLLDPAGRPVPGVAWATNPGPLRERALRVDVGADGAFSMSLPAGRWRFWAESPVHLPSPSRDLDLVTGQELDLGTLGLRPAASLRLRVVDERGRGVPGARIRIARRDGGTQGVTDSTGVAHLVGLPAGRHALSVMADDFEGSADGRVQLIAGKEVEHEVVLAALGWLEVSVLTTAGDPAVGAAVRVVDAQGHSLFSARTDAQGWMAPHALPEGTALLVASLDGYVAHQPVAVEAHDTLRVGLTLDVGLELRGVALTASGHPISDLAVSLRGATAHDKPESRTDAEGRFVFAGLAPTPHEVVARRGRGAGATRVRRTLVPGRDSEEIVLRLPPLDGLPVAGHVLAGGEGVPGAVVVARQGIDEIDRCLSAVDGGFRFEALPEGTYRLYASAGDQRGVLAIDTSRSRTGLTLDMVAGGFVEVRVLGGAHGPAEGARVHLRLGGSEERMLARTDAAGQARLGPLFPGEYRLSVDGLGPSELEVRPVLFPLAAGEIVEHELVAVRRED